MASGSMICLRISVFILVMCLCISHLANGQTQKKSEKNISREFRLEDAKFPSLDINQAEGQGSSSANNAERKTFNVFMRPLMPEGHGLIVTDDSVYMHMLYKINQYGENSEEFVLKDIRHGENVFTISRRKSLINRRFIWEGYRGPKSSGSLFTRASFRVEEPSDGGLFASKSTACNVKYKGKRYTLDPCKIADQSPDAKVEFKITKKNGKTIGELKSKYSSSGKWLGRYALSLVVEPGEDESFVVAILAVFSLINHEKI